VPNFVTCAASITELAHGEKSSTQLHTQSVTQSPSLFHAPGTEVFASEYVNNSSSFSSFNLDVSFSFPSSCQPLADVDYALWQFADLLM